MKLGQLHEARYSGTPKGYIVVVTMVDDDDEVTLYGEEDDRGFVDIVEEHPTVFDTWEKAVSCGKDIVNKLADQAEDGLMDYDDGFEIWTSTSVGGDFKGTHLGDGIETVSIYYDNKNDSEEYAEIEIKKV